MIVAAETVGVIEGGWAFVYAAYGVTWLFFSGYALSLWLRLRGIDD